MKETAVYKWQASIPHHHQHHHHPSPPTCSDVALCGHRTASKSQAGETRRGERAESSKRQPPSPPPLTPRPPTHEHNLPSPRRTPSSPPAACKESGEEIEEEEEGNSMPLSQLYTQKKWQALLWGDINKCVQCMFLAPFIFYILWKSHIQNWPLNWYD